MTLTAPHPFAVPLATNDGPGRVRISLVTVVGPPSEALIGAIRTTAESITSLNGVELVVVEDRAGEIVRATLVDLGPKCRVLHTLRRVGDGEALVAAVAIAAGEIIVLMSGGVPLDRAEIDQLTDPFSADPGVGAVCATATGVLALRRSALTSIGGPTSLRREATDRGPIAGVAAAGLLRAGWRLLDLSPPPGATFSRPQAQTWERDVSATLDPIARPIWNPPSISSTPKPGVNVIGLLEAACGVGDAARRYVEAIDTAGVPLSTFSFHGHGSPEHPFIHHGTHDLAYDTNLLALNADVLIPFATLAGRALWSSARYTIGLWFWELERLSPSIEQCFALVHEVWASSPFLQAAFSSGTDKPVTYVPLPVDRHEGTPSRSRAELGLPSGFVFLTIFDFGSLSERKNATGVVRAFCDAFAPGSDPVLVLKTLNAGSDREGWSNLQKAVGGRRDVIIIDGYLDEESVSEVIGHADCYVSLHRAEGFGLTPAEAMAWGRPVIATGYSGNLAFMTPENSYLIGYDTIDVPREYHNIYRLGSTWAAPHHDEAVAAMRSVVAAPASAAERGLRGQRDIRRTNSLDVATATVGRRLKEIHEFRSGALVRSTQTATRHRGGR